MLTCEAVIAGIQSGHTTMVNFENSPGLAVSYVALPKLCDPGSFWFVMGGPVKSRRYRVRLSPTFIDIDGTNEKLKSMTSPARIGP